MKTRFFKVVFFVDSIVFFLAVALTSSALIIERMEGLLDRSWVAGVSPGEILFSHVVTQFVVMCGQTALVLIFMILVFGVECKGDIGWVIILTILQGLCGMCFGKTRRLFIHVSVKIIQQIDDDLQFLREMRLLSQKCKYAIFLLFEQANSDNQKTKEDVLQFEFLFSQGL